jgi:hypothetical protein
MALGFFFASILINFSASWRNSGWLALEVGRSLSKSRDFAGETTIFMIQILAKNNKEIRIGGTWKMSFRMQASMNYMAAPKHEIYKGLFQGWLCLE